jgi:hypothetical protein
MNIISILPVLVKIMAKKILKNLSPVKKGLLRLLLIGLAFPVITACVGSVDPDGDILGTDDPGGEYGNFADPQPPLKETGGSSYHVKTGGSQPGTGTADSPWPLPYALNGAGGKIKPGDMILIHGGTYTGNFAASLNGSADKPITIRNYGDGEVILDGNNSIAEEAVLNFSGSHTWICGLTIQNSSGLHTAVATDLKDGVYFNGPDNKLINCIIRNNNCNGIGFWSGAINSEIYGCIIYHNGYTNTARGHGHGIYAQNASGKKLIQDNIIFNPFGGGIQIYTEGGSIEGFNLEGNAFFVSGRPNNTARDHYIIVGGTKNAADDITIKNNYFYDQAGGYPAKAMVQLGYEANNGSAVFSGNYMAAGDAMSDGVLSIRKGWASLSVTQNTILSRQNIYLLFFDSDSQIAAFQFNNNTYHRGSFKGMNFDAWKNFSGKDSSSSYSASLPTQAKTVVIKNRYENGRGTAVIYNWANAASVELDVSSFLSDGDTCKVYDVSCLSGGSIAERAVSNGKINVPMTGLTQVDKPNGPDQGYGSRYGHCPDYNAFLIIRN